NDDQKQRWPAMWRHLTREKSLNRGRLSGESLDLLRMVDEVAFPLELRESLKPILGDYEMRLDAALQARNAELERGGREMLQAAQGRDERAAAAIIERQI